DRFRDVYRTLVLGKDLFGVALYPQGPGLNLDGTIDAADYEEAHQTSVRDTLPSLPMLEGHDYTIGGVPSYGSEAATPGCVPPLVWVWNTADGVYQLADVAGLTVSVLRTEWGFRLGATPGHKLAPAAHWEGHEGTSPHAPVWDIEMTVATLAFRTDARLALEYEVPGAADGSTLEIYVPGAELWYIQPETHLRRSDQGTWMDVAASNCIARNDAPRLARIMAGAIARYGLPRGRAEVQVAGLAPYGSLLGSILSTLEEVGGDAQAILAPVTSVDWRFDPKGPTTTVRAGFAR
ncbi:MAG: hypothetical protein IMZ66_11285, partial [Planctomycetes bacterium]|nr:hypothetical protein [Planctomycetota bacterium]